jgi:hypothetical protein
VLALSLTDGFLAETDYYGLYPGLIEVIEESSIRSK